MKINQKKNQRNDYVYVLLMPSVIDFPKTFLSSSKINLKSFNSYSKTKSS